MRTALNVRFAFPADASALLRIYAEYIETSITFEYDLPSEAEFSTRIAEYGREFPYLTVWDGERAVAYAYAHRAWERAAYGWTAELSIYIAQAYTGLGLGRVLYEALLAMVERQGVKVVYGVVTDPNEASFALHEALGFHCAARFARAGFKAGTWHDVVWFEKELAPRDGAPQPVRPISAVEEADELVRRCEAAIQEKLRQQKQ